MGSKPSKAKVTTTLSAVPGSTTITADAPQVNLTSLAAEALVQTIHIGSELASPDPRPPSCNLLVASKESNRSFTLNGIKNIIDLLAWDGLKFIIRKRIDWGAIDNKNNSNNDNNATNDSLFLTVTSSGGLSTVLSGWGSKTDGEPHSFLSTMTFDQKQGIIYYLSHKGTIISKSLNNNNSSPSSQTSPSPITVTANECIRIHQGKLFTINWLMHTIDSYELNECSIKLSERIGLGKGLGEGQLYGPIDFSLSPDSNELYVLERNYHTNNQYAHRRISIFSLSSSSSSSSSSFIRSIDISKPSTERAIPYHAKRIIALTNNRFALLNEIIDQKEESVGGEVWLYDGKSCEVLDVAQPEQSVEGSLKLSVTRKEEKKLIGIYDGNDADRGKGLWMLMKGGEDYSLQWWSLN